MKKCTYCNHKDPTAIELSMFLSDIFLRRFLCEKCDTYHYVCPRCRKGEILCPNCNSALVEGDVKLERFNKELIAKNDDAALKTLKEMSGCINEKLDYYGSGVVHLCVRYGRVKVLKEAIKMGGDYISENRIGLTPLCFAYLHNRNISIRILESLISGTPSGLGVAATPVPDSDDLSLSTTKSANQKSECSHREHVNMNEKESLTEKAVLKKSGNGNAEYRRGMDILNKTMRMELSGPHGAIWLRKDVDKILSWLRKAADKGHVNAQFQLGWWYAKNWANVYHYELSPDYEQAITWFTKAAINGHSGAQYYLGEMYIKEQGVVSDLDNARNWFRKAAEQGCKDAQNALSKMDEQAQANVVEVPVDDVKDTLNSLIEMVGTGDEDALKALHNLAKQGNVYAQYKLGELYIDVEFDNKKAAIWYGKAATQGHAGALEALFEMAEQSDEDALKALHTVAKQGDADTQYRLGVIYTEVVFDDAQAAKLYHKAAIQRHSDALDALFEMAAQCDENAFKSLRSIARQGDADIQYRLGSIYSEVEFDDQKAATWYRKAIKQGHAEAQNALDALDLTP